jgi:hypothetical protein
MIIFNKTNDPNKYEIIIEIKGKSVWFSENDNISKKVVIGNVIYTKEDEDKRIALNNRVQEIIKNRCLKLGLDAEQAIKNFTVTAEDIMMLSYFLNQETSEEAFKFFESKLISL